MKSNLTTIIDKPVRTSVFKAVRAAALGSAVVGGIALANYDPQPNSVKRVEHGQDYTVEAAYFNPTVRIALINKENKDAISYGFDNNGDGKIDHIIPTPLARKVLGFYNMEEVRSKVQNAYNHVNKDGKKNKN